MKKCLLNIKINYYIDTYNVILPDFVFSWKWLNKIDILFIFDFKGWWEQRMKE